MPANEFLLPQGRLIFSHDLPDNVYTLITGGRAPAKDWLDAARRGHLWALDHGIDICHEMKLLPERLIGDGDSASPQAWDWALASGVRTELFSPRKDLTDTQIALHRLKEAHTPCFLLITGAFGGRFDHAMSTIFSFAHMHLPGLLADEKEACFFLRGNERFAFAAEKKAKAISLLPMTEECLGVNLEGTAWPLQDARLSQHEPYAVSNEFAVESSSFSVSLAKGVLAVYLYWE